jgi:hypothetical protein
MTFVPGESGNPEGRPVGSENKLTRKAKYYAEKFLDEIERQGIEEITRTGKMSDYITLLKSILPTKVETESTVTVTQPIKIKFED